MILTGKDLMRYRMNQIKKIAMMATGTIGTVIFMMLMVAAYC